jgi:homoserine acetyltransferase
LIETYLDHAGEKFSLEYDPNSLLYVSKAMDLFDLGQSHQFATKARREENSSRQGRFNDASCSLTLPAKNYEEQGIASEMEKAVDNGSASGPPEDLVAGMKPMKDHPVLVMGVASDILFPAWQQREIAETIKATGNVNVKHVELGEDLSLFGHDTFLLDLEHIGGNLGKFLG